MARSPERKQPTGIARQSQMWPLTGKDAEQPRSMVRELEESLLQGTKEAKLHKAEDINREIDMVLLKKLFY